MSFCHLHVHTKYSLLDGLSDIPELIKRAKEMGQDALAITDHGNMFGAVEFYKEAKKQGIKPIIGCEVYMSIDSRFNHNNGEKNYHLILLAENNKGYSNLAKLVSFGYTEGFYYKPRIDFKLLSEFSEGIICLTACMSGAFSYFLLNDNTAKAEEILLKLKDIFKDKLYVELQDHHIPEQKKIIPKQIELAKKHNIKLVATNDSHYTNKEDSIYQEILMCIQTQKTLSDEDRMRFATNEFYLKSEEEMMENFSFCPEAISNTEEIAKMCNVEFTFNKYHLPKFKTETNETSEEMLRRLCIEGLKTRYKNDYEKCLDRLNYELDTINKMGFTDYFLIVWDFINYAKKNGIPVGPGRGSAAGSIVSYSLHITDIDPLKYNLVFERFLNTERVTMPDIDVDFCYERRSEVIDYVIKKYGKDNVSQIITFGTFGAKQVVRDAARVLDIPYAEGDKIAKLIKKGVKVTLEEAIAESDELRNLLDTDENAKKIMKVARKLEGLPRHASTHAAGVVITNKPIMEYVPLYKGDGIILTQYTMTTIEELGLLKMDFLGLRNLTVINDAFKLVNQRYNNNLNTSNISYSDPEVFKLFKRGETDGIFQFESPGMKRFLRELAPESIEDLVLAVSIYRPGPMKEIPNLIKNKKNPNGITYDHESLRDILSVTYGCIVYQEQVMKIFQKLAGYTLGRADIVRRAMSKKKMDVLEKEQEVFIDGCKKNNIDRKTALIIFDKIKDFAKYAFNKSHAVCYAYVAYQTAYLKCHYKVEFTGALMTVFSENQNKVTEYIRMGENMGVTVLPPSVNKSKEGFITYDDKIVFGFSAIKNVGQSASKEIVLERELHGEFESFDNFVMRMVSHDINKRTTEALIKSGAFDDLGNRLDLLKTNEETVDYYLNRVRRNIPGQMTLFDEGIKETEPLREKPAPYIIHKNKITDEETRFLNKMQKEVLGISLAPSPLKKYKEIILRTATVSSIDIINSENEESELKDGDSVVIVGIVRDKKVNTTKKGSQMARFTVEDIYGNINAIAFPKAFNDNGMYIYEENTVRVLGTMIINDDEPPLVNVKKISPFNPEVVSGKLYLKIDDVRLINDMKAILKEHKGNTPVYVYFAKEKKNTLAEKGLWVTVSNTLTERLKKLLGDKNVVLKKQE